MIEQGMRLIEHKTDSLCPTVTVTLLDHPNPRNLAVYCQYQFYQLERRIEKNL